MEKSDTSGQDADGHAVGGTTRQERNYWTRHGSIIYTRVDLAALLPCSPALRCVWLCLLPTPVLRPPCEQGVASFGHDEVIMSQLPGFGAKLGEGAQCDSLKDSRAQYQASFILEV